jgi:SAM-dependent methyltransferase
MRDSVLPLLACPHCDGVLHLAARERARDGHVMSGWLDCGGCAARYPIESGLPRLILDEVHDRSVETAARFGAEWETFDHLADYDEVWLRGWLDPVRPQEFAGKRIFEGGCGKGRHTVTAARWGAREVVALDLGAAAQVAFAHTRALENVHIIQGDLLRPPVRRVFDLAFSIGVLHHLTRPRAGFDALRSRVRPGGKVAIWVYGRESNEWIVRWVNPLREVVTARMSPRLLYWLSLLPSAALAGAARLYRWPGLSDRLPYGEYMRLLATVPLREVHSIVFDQLVTPIAYYLPGDEVRRWFEDRELQDVQIAWHNKNSWRACATIGEVRC